MKQTHVRQIQLEVERESIATKVARLKADLEAAQRSLDDIDKALSRYCC